MTDKLKITFTNAKTVLLGSHPSWSNQRVESLARIFTALEFGLHKPYLSSFPLSAKLRNFCESTGLQIHEDGTISNFLVQYNVPAPTIVESSKDTDKESEFNEKTIKGIAIYPTASLNNNRYYKSEIATAAKSLRNKPIQKDHQFSVEATFGTIDKEIYNVNSGKLEYLGRVDADDPVTEKIARGYVKNSSVGLRAEFVECNICKEKMSFWHEHIPGFEYEGKKAEAIPRNFRFNHIGVVSFPGITGATANVESEESEHDNMHESAQEIYLDLLTEAFTPLEQQINESLIGETKMTNEADYKVALENEKLKLQMEAKNKETLRIQKEFDDLKAKTEADKRTSLIEEIIKLELTPELKKLEEAGIPQRKVALESLTTNHLEARKTALKEVFDLIPPKETPHVPKKPLSKDFSQTGEGGEPVITELAGRAAIEQKVEWLGKQMFGLGYKPSWSAIETLDNWDAQRQEWRRPLKEFLL